MPTTLLLLSKKIVCRMPPVVDADVVGDGASLGLMYRCFVQMLLSIVVEAIHEQGSPVVSYRGPMSDRDKCMS